MNIIIFAGGAGTRLWPLSRQNSPKQFEQLKDDTSTLQMMVERIKPFGQSNMYISTNDAYKKLIQEQVPAIAENHIFTEPARRDLAAAVGLTLLRLNHAGKTGTVAVLWSDHFMDHPQRFQTALKKADTLIQKKCDRFVFFGENARFANHNLGWIKLGKNISDNEYAFETWKYRPAIDECKKMFVSGQWVWNPGYFVFDIEFCLSLYEQYQPEMYTELEKMVADPAYLADQYHTLPKLSFDEAIVEHLRQDQATVLKVDLGWSDPGTLYALKEALVGDGKENYTKGLVVSEDTTDSFIYNEEKTKLVTTIGLEGMVVVNTKDALLVCHKDDVPEIKTLLKDIEIKQLSEFL